ncbi:long-chain fatty acid--CoA ligase [Kocuria sp.]|uniref:acyl-CoA synthetase n=1 Tax=Kocuria sp. TaxID=1871328 RepID=UPI0026E0C084|nr:long-chain fatty acid--CoA ligase [Kocuria sp.]MDO5366858.1 long-chain fatty acid--CoA ligase [Kocuria sp.]
MNLGIGTWPARRVMVRPDATAVVFEGRSVSYRDFELRVRKLANALRDSGVEHGDRVAYMGFNHPSLLETFFATGLLGAAAVLINPRLRRAEVDYILRDCGATTVAFGRDQGANATVLEPELTDVRTWLSVDGEGPGQDYEAFLQSGGEAAVDEQLDLDELALIMYTSGTTGKPKGAMLTHNNLFYQYVNAMIGQDLRQDEVHLAVAPLFHIAGLNMMTLPTFMLGGTIIIHRQFRAVDVLRELEDSRVTSSFMVPAMLDSLSHTEGFDTADFSSVRAFMVGGSPLPERMLRTWAELDVAVMQGFGMTETAPGVRMLEPRDGVVKLGSAGRQHFFTESGLVDPLGDPVAPGQAGEVIVRGPNVMAGYWNKPEETAKALDGGWYHSGDIAVEDEDGYLFIKDRIKDMYISGGENVYPAEVENALLDVSGVQEAAVIGVPDEKWGETGRAFVVLFPDTAGLTGPRIREHLQDRLASYKLPAVIDVVAELPRTTTGKIQKHVLRERP